MEEQEHLVLAGPAHPTSAPVSMYLPGQQMSRSRTLRFATFIDAMARPHAVPSTRLALRVLVPKQISQYTTTQLPARPWASISNIPGVLLTTSTFSATLCQTN